MLQKSFDTTFALANSLLNNFYLTNRARRLQMLKFQSIFTKSDWVIRARLASRRIKRYVCARRRHLAAVKLQQALRRMVLRCNPTMLAHAACLQRATPRAVSIIQRAMRVYLLKHRVSQVASFNSQLRMDAAAQTRSFLAQYDYDDSLTMRLYQSQPRLSLPVYMTDAKRTGGSCKIVALSETEKLWRQAYARTQMDSAMATEAAWQSVKSLNATGRARGGYTWGLAQGAV